jgi:hypothetical protein
VEEYFTTILQDYDREMERFSPEVRPDPNYLRFFIFTL